MFNNLVKHEIGLREDKMSYEKGKPHFVMGGNGVFKVLRKDAILNKVQVAKLTSSFKIPLLQDISEEFEYILPKIPFKHYINILDFFKAVYEKDGTEASCMIYYNQTEEEIEIPTEYATLAEKGLDIDGKWLIYAPKQVNTATLTDFRGDLFDEWLRANYTKVIECHSHNVMNSFWSGTDNSNQKENMYYGVFGKITTEDTFLLKAVANDGKIYDNLPVDSLFEFPKVKLTKEIVGVDTDSDTPLADLGQPELVTYKGSFNRLNKFKPSWIEQHTKGGSFGHSAFNTYGKVNDFKDDSDFPYGVKGKEDFLVEKKFRTPISELTNLDKQAIDQAVKTVTKSENQKEESEIVNDSYQDILDNVKNNKPSKIVDFRK